MEWNLELKNLEKLLIEELESAKTVNNCLKIGENYTNSGLLLELKNEIKSAVEIQKKKEIGSQINILRELVQNLTSKKIKLIQEVLEKDSFVKIDTSVFIKNKLYSEGGQQKPGILHPISETINEIMDIFAVMGFDIFQGDQLERQLYNFTLVGTPDYHPARGMQDTFFLQQQDQLNENYVMKTQVTASIAKYAQIHKPPFKVLFPGVVFRAENIDATHDINFHQFDMWMVDKDLSIAQLFSIIKRLFQEFFNDPNLQVRMRPSYFPFTQPSFEIDIFASWFKNGQWIEVAGAGPIHNQVLENIGIDPKTWSGLAFGFGLTRLCQLKNKITGISQFYNGDLNFLSGK